MAPTPRVTIRASCLAVFAALAAAACASVDLAGQSELAAPSRLPLAEVPARSDVEAGTEVELAVSVDTSPDRALGTVDPLARVLLSEVSPGPAREPARAAREPITLGFAGDTSFNGGLEQVDPLGEVTDLLAEPDLMVVNLETAVADFGVGIPPVDKRFLFLSPPAAIRLLAESGVDVVTLANNHALDFGYPALVATLDGLRSVGLQPVGAHEDPSSAYDALITTVGQWDIGIVSLSRVPCDWSWQGENTRPGVAWACDPFLQDADAAVAASVEQADVTVVMVHGGTEGELCPDEVMRDLNRRWAELGADVVVNSHPHVVQGITSIGETLVIRSTGNFAFPPAVGLTANSALFTVEVSDHGLFVSVTPLVSDFGVVSLPESTRSASILEQIHQHSSGWNVLSDGSTRQDPGVQRACGE